MTPGVPRDPKTAIFCPKCPFLAIGTSNSSKWVGHWLDKVGYYQTHPEGSIWTLEAPKKWHRRPQRRQKFNKCIQKFNKLNKCIQTSGRVFALHSGLKRGVRWGGLVLSWDTVIGYHNPLNLIWAIKGPQGPWLGTWKWQNWVQMISLNVFHWHQSNFHLMGVTRDLQGHIGPKKGHFGPNWAIKGPQGPWIGTWKWQNWAQMISLNIFHWY